MRIAAGSCAAWLLCGHASGRPRTTSHTRGRRATRAQRPPRSEGIGAAGEERSCETMVRLSDDDIRVAVEQMSGWSLEEGELVKTFAFSTFPDGIAFVNRVADLAEDAGHHPDIIIKYSRVTLRLSTHDEGGITDKDFRLARRVDALVGR